MRTFKQVKSELVARLHMYEHLVKTCKLNLKRQRGYTYSKNYKLYLQWKELVNETLLALYIIKNKGLPTRDVFLNPHSRVVKALGYIEYYKNFEPA